jgi:CBS domain-containing protein
MVFCPLLARSVPPDICGHCTHAVSRTEDSVSCRIERPRDEGRPRVDVAEAAARTHVGEVLDRETVCVREDTYLEVAFGLLADGAACVPVVSDSGRLVGMVRPGAAASDGSVLAGQSAGPVGVAVPESLPVSMAIAVLARSDGQPLAVLSEAGAVVGVLGAVDVVRWLATRMGYDAC